MLSGSVWQDVRIIYIFRAINYQAKIIAISSIEISHFPLTEVEPVI
jgi:hypothetical protein